ncbi:MmgE/PrpD family protein [Halomonas sp. AOP42-D1-22]|uniref:MmgE/PrpD family protein n=1 Tax=Halomonas sp. AOP42-D1-22 TaxID=3457667 RepID=UPI0040349BCB
MPDLSLQDQVAFSPEEGSREGKYFIIEGNVQGVGFRRWVNKKANQLGINGWVRNVGNDKVEGAFQGAELKVSNLLHSCGAGPYRSQVDSIYYSPLDEKIYKRFEILESALEPKLFPEKMMHRYDGKKAAINSIFPAKSKKEKRKEIYNYISALGFDDLREKDIKRAKFLLLDALGLIFLASNDRRMDKVREIGLQLSGGAAESSVVGLSDKVSSPAAAFVYSSYMQLHDFNDGHRVAAARGGDAHPGRVVIPSAIAEAELFKVSGKDLITAIAVGYDVAARIRGRKPNRPKSPQYAAAAVSAKLRNFSPQEVAGALGYAGYLSASGFGTNSTGTDKNFLSKGFQAYAGLLGSRVGASGQKGPLIDFDEKKTRPFLLSSAGAGFEVSKVYVKPCPTCRMTHSPVTALKNAMDLLEVDHAEIKSIILRQLPSGMYVAKMRPKPGIDYKHAQFNVYYCLARYAMDRRLGVEQFSKEKCSEKSLFDFMSKVEVVKDVELSKGYPFKRRSASVEVETVDGRRIKCQVDLPPGSAEDFSEDLVSDKFYTNCDGVIRRPDAESLYDMVMSIEGIGDVSLLSKKMKECFNS